MTHGLRSPFVNRDEMLGHGGLECELAGHFHKSKGTKRVFVMDHSGRKTLFGHGGLVFELAENYQNSMWEQKSP